MGKIKAQKRKVIFKFSPDKYFTVLSSVLNLMILEKRDFEQKAVRITDIFRQDIKAFDNKEKIILLDGRCKDVYEENLTIEFGSEEYFNALYKFTNAMADEREEMNKRHINIIEEIKTQIDEYV